MADRFLIVNADDLGLSAAVNEGIFEAHERGIVTSASLMVRRPAADATADALAAHLDLAVGLHLEFPSAFVFSSPVGEKGRTPAVEECWAQLERFRELVGRDPTHLDSHKHVHEAEPVRAVAEAMAVELGVPLRNRVIRYEGGFYGRDAISVEYLIELIEGLQSGWTEIGCHPAAGPVPSSSYDSEREIELRALLDPRVKNLLNVTSVQLCSFAQVFDR